MSQDTAEDGDEIERAEAAALAHALERGVSQDALPEDALKTGALLAYSADGGALSPAREDALLSDVLAAADRLSVPSAPTRPARAPFWRWVFGGVGLSLATAAILLVVFRAPDVGPMTPTALPLPDASLLAAEIARVSGQRDDDDAFEGAMGEYRGQVYGALRARYGAR